MPKSDDTLNPTDDEAHSFSLLLRSAYFAMRRHCNALCDEHGCNGDQFVILSVLFECVEGVTQQEMAERAGYDAATTGTMLRTLEEREIVMRTPHPTDGRAKIVKLTRKGRKLFEELWNSTRDFRAELWGSMSSSSRATTVRNLGSIAENMNSLQASRGEKT
jgi:DNA-binding MarR family transcriptional regulator